MGESKEASAAKIASELSDTQKMMYAFGDSRRPKAETAKVLEAVVLSQIAGVVAQVLSLVLVFTHLTSFPGCQGGNIKRVKDPWSGGLALPHETQSCEGNTNL